MQAAVSPDARREPERLRMTLPARENQERAAPASLTNDHACRRGGSDSNRVEAQQREERVGGREGTGRKTQRQGGEEGKKKQRNKGLGTLNL